MGVNPTRHPIPHLPQKKQNQKNRSFWMIICTNVIHYQFCLTSLSLFSLNRTKRNKIKHISHDELCLFTHFALVLLKNFSKQYLGSTVVQTRLSSIAIIYIEKCYVNRIFQVLMDRIIDIFEKITRFVHVLIILLYIGLRRLFQQP